MKQLGFDVKRNLKRSPRIYVKSPDLKITYGSFLADQPSQFKGWDQLNESQSIELIHYIQNIDAVIKHLGNTVLNEQADYRLRLPITFIDVLNDISVICKNASIEFNVFEPILATMVQQLKISVAKLPSDNKKQALSILDKIGLAEYKKTDYTQQTQAIFSELLPIPNKSEKLHRCAKVLFDKDKSYSPNAIEGMSQGATIPSKWLVCCAIEVLINEKPAILTKLLSEDDIFILWAKPLLDHKKKDSVIDLIKKHNFNFLSKRINNPNIK